MSNMPTNLLNIYNIAVSIGLPPSYLPLEPDTYHIIATHNISRQLLTVLTIYNNNCAFHLKLANWDSTSKTWQHSISRYKQLYITFINIANHMKRYSSSLLSLLGLGRWIMGTLVTHHSYQLSAPLWRKPLVSAPSVPTSEPEPFVVHDAEWMGSHWGLQSSGTLSLSGIKEPHHLDALR